MSAPDDELEDIATAAGFVALYRAESERVLVFCARRVLDAEAAVDLTAETFAQAYRGRGRFTGTSRAQVQAWLLTIARRQIARYLEKGRRDRALVERVGIQIPRMDPGEIEEVERRAGLAQLRATLAPELARLSPGQRQALRLRVVEERSYEEIAQALDITEQTARARVSRGLRTLQEALAQEGEPAWQSR